MTTTPINLETLIPRCHEASKANGWWEPRPNAGQQLMLVVSELAEALEAHRSGAKKNPPLVPKHVKHVLAQMGNPRDAARLFFQNEIKDSVGDELADAYIRLCDYAGGMGLSIAEVAHHEAIWGGRYGGLYQNFGEALLEITRGIATISEVDNALAAETLGCCLCEINELAARDNIDLATHINLKLAYNATRGHKHGGKAY